MGMGWGAANCVLAHRPTCPKRVPAAQCQVGPKRAQLGTHKHRYGAPRTCTLFMPGAPEAGTQLRLLPCPAHLEGHAVPLLHFRVRPGGFEVVLHLHGGEEGAGRVTGGAAVPPNRARVGWKAAGRGNRQQAAPASGAEPCPHRSSRG